MGYYYKNIFGCRSTWQEDWGRIFPWLAWPWLLRTGQPPARAASCGSLSTKSPGSRAAKNRNSEGTGIFHRGARFAAAPTAVAGGFRASRARTPWQEGKAEGTLVRPASVGPEADYEQV